MTTDRIRKMPTDEKLKLSVGELCLPPRARKCLMHFGVSTLGDLVRLNQIEMLKFKNFGKVSLNRIESELAEIGLYLEG